MGPGRETVAELVSKHFTVQSFAFHTTGLVAATSLIGDPINCDESKFFITSTEFDKNILE